MSFGQPSFIAVGLVGPQAASSYANVESKTVLYGSTAGPFDGIGGAAMTQFTITRMTAGNHEVYFADDRFLGWRTREPGAEVAALLVYARDLNTDPASCPLPLS